MTSKEMQEQWLKKNKPTVCEDSMVVYDGKNLKKSELQTYKSSLPNRFERKTSHVTCIKCRSKMTPTKSPKTKGFYIVCKDCIRDEQTVKKREYARSNGVRSFRAILVGQLRELNIHMENVTLASDEKLQEWLKTAEAIELYASVRNSDASRAIGLPVVYRKLKIAIEDELDRRIAQEEAVGDYNTSVNGYEFDF